MSVDLHPSDQRNETISGTSRRGPMARIVAGSLAAGLGLALVLALGVFAGAAESTITGSMLVGFGIGWALIGVLSARLTDHPQRWMTVPAVAMAGTGIVLLVCTPENAMMTRLSWVWPPVALALAAWIWVQIRRELPDRSRWLLVPVVGVLALAAVGATYENITVIRDQHTYAAPGTTYDVGGHELYLDCRGQGSPTVVLANGLGEVAASWARIVDELDDTTRVCAYDRAGQGWSQEAEAPQDAVAAADDLHTLLSVAGEEGPFVLVGHSTGGPYSMTFAAQYPQQVAGMVLLDSSSPHQATAIPSFSGQFAATRRAMAVVPTLSRLGVGQVAAAIAPSHLPEPAGDVVRALTASARGARNVRDEQSVLLQVFEQAQALTTLDERPLAVLTTSESLETAGWGEAQDQLAGLSPNEEHWLVDSTHLGLLEDRHGAAVSVRAIDDVVAGVRTGSTVSAR